MKGRTARSNIPNMYELVHVNDGNPLPQECRMQKLLECHIFSIIPTAMNGSGRGWHTWPFFLFGAYDRTGASGENVSPQTTGLQKVQEWPGVSVGKLHLFTFYFAERADCRYSKSCLQNVSRKYSKIWLRRNSIKAYLTPKVDSTLKLSNYYSYVTTQSTLAFRTNVHMLTSFFIDWRWNLVCVFYESLSSRWRMVFFFLSFFPPYSLILLLPKHPPPKINMKLSGKKYKKAFVNGWVGAHKTRVPNFRVLHLQKNGVNFGIWPNFGAICLETVCRTTYLVPYGKSDR